MKNLRCLVIAALLALSVSTSILAGDIQGVGLTAPCAPGDIQGVGCSAPNPSEVETSGDATAQILASIVVALLPAIF
jgi:hypothetical protein